MNKTTKLLAKIETRELEHELLRRAMIKAQGEIIRLSDQLDAMKEKQARRLIELAVFWGNKAVRHA